MKKKTDHELMVKVNSRIKEIMKECHYTQREMADILEMSVSSFANKINLSNGKFNLEELVKICDEFFLTLDELVK